MITPQEAVESAVTYLVGIVGKLEQPQNFTVEKLTLSSDKKVWTVVLGYDRKAAEANNLSVLLGNNPRQFKLIEIDADTKEGLSFDTFNPNKN